MIPFTCFLNFSGINDEQRIAMLNDYAEHGGKNIVFTNDLVKQFAFEPEARRKIKKQVADAGLTFVDAHAPYAGELDLMLPDDIRSIGLARHYLTLELVRDCGADTCCFHLGNAPVFPQYTLDELHTFICRTLEKLLKRAEELKIAVCIENIFKPINTVSEILKLIKMFNSPYLGVCYDSGHANIMEKGMNFPGSRPWAQWNDRGDVEWEHHVLEQLLEHIVICHLHDNDAINDLHLLPGDGTVDWEHTFSLLKQAPKLKYIQSETNPGRHNISLALLQERWQAVLQKYFYGH